RPAAAVGAVTTPWSDRLRSRVGWHPNLPSRSRAVADRVRAAFVGAGNRAFSAHYPTVKRLADQVELAAVCEVDPARLARGADFFDLPPERRYDDLNRLLAEVKPELVYTIMGPTFVRAFAERCL